MKFLIKVKSIRSNWNSVITANLNETDADDSKPKATSKCFTVFSRRNKYLMLDA